MSELADLLFNLTEKKSFVIKVITDKTTKYVYSCVLKAKAKKFYDYAVSYNEDSNDTDINVDMTTFNSESVVNFLEYIHTNKKKLYQEKDLNYDELIDYYYLIKTFIHEPDFLIENINDFKQVDTFLNLLKIYKDKKLNDLQFEYHIYKNIIFLTTNSLLPKESLNYCYQNSSLRKSYHDSVLCCYHYLEQKIKKVKDDTKINLNLQIEEENNKCISYIFNGLELPKKCNTDYCCSHRSLSQYQEIKNVIADVMPSTEITYTDKMVTGIITDITFTKPTNITTNVTTNTTPNITTNITPNITTNTTPNITSILITKSNDCCYDGEISNLSIYRPTNYIYRLCCRHNKEKNDLIEGTSLEHNDLPCCITKPKFVPMATLFCCEHRTKKDIAELNYQRTKMLKRINPLFDITSYLEYDTKKEICIDEIEPGRYGKPINKPFDHLMCCHSLYKLNGNRFLTLKNPTNMLKIKSKSNEINKNGLLCISHIIGGTKFNEFTNTSYCCIHQTDSEYQRLRSMVKTHMFENKQDDIINIDINKMCYDDMFLLKKDNTLLCCGHNKTKESTSRERYHENGKYCCIHQTNEERIALLNEFKIKLQTTRKLLWKYLNSITESKYLSQINCDKLYCANKSLCCHELLYNFSTVPSKNIRINNSIPCIVFTAIGQVPNMNSYTYDCCVHNSYTENQIKKKNYYLKKTVHQILYKFCLVLGFGFGFGFVFALVLFCVGSF